MKIKIKSGETRFTLMFPTCLILNRLGGTIVARVIKKKTDGKVSLKQKDITALLRALKRFKKRQSEHPLAEIQSNDGSEVLILL